MNLLNNHPKKISVLIFLSVILFFYLGHNFLNIKGSAQELEDSITYYILGIFTSMLLLFLAYIKIDEANKQSKMNYLLRIDERWASAEIIKAREVIHKLYLDAKDASPQNQSSEELRSLIGRQIKNLHDNKDKIESFIYLLNFLDFLETIGYLHSVQAVTIIEIRELLGNSIVYFFDIFKIFIDFRRNDTGDKKFYEHFETLYKEMKEYKEQRCWYCNTFKRN